MQFQKAKQRPNEKRPKKKVKKRCRNIGISRPDGPARRCRIEILLRWWECELANTRWSRYHLIIGVSGRKKTVSQKRHSEFVRDGIKLVNVTESLFDGSSGNQAQCLLALVLVIRPWVVKIAAVAEKFVRRKLGKAVQEGQNAVERIHTITEPESEPVIVLTVNSHGWQASTGTCWTSYRSHSGRIWPRSGSSSIARILSHVTGLQS